MLKGRQWEIKYDKPATRGMLSAADLLDVPRDFATLLKNADMSKTFGAVEKDTGFDVHAVMAEFPDDMENILSVGWFPYTKMVTLPGGDEEAREVGYLFVQVDNNEEENGLDWYWIEYSFDDKVWMFPWSDRLNESDIQGTTKAGLIKWTNFPGVLRGACGKEFDSNPLWIGYVNRKIENNEGFFHDYRTPEDIDMLGVTGVITTAGLPKANLWMTAVPFEHGDGLLGEGDYVFILVPEYDGHQISDHNLADGFAGHKPYKYVSLDANSYLRIYIKYQYTNDAALGRLSAFNLYMAKKDVGVATWSNWSLVRRIDIRTGTTARQRTQTMRFEHLGGSINGQMRDVGQCWPNPYLWWNSFVEINVLDDNDEPKIEIYNVVAVEATQTPTSNTMFKFTYEPAESFLVDGEDYTVCFSERWKFGYEIYLQLSDEYPSGTAPSWLIPPDKLYDESFDDLDIFPNYKQSILFGDRHLVGDFYRDGKYEPLLLAYSNAVNDPFAGHDLFPNTHEIPSNKAGDKIMGFGASLQILSIFTKYDIFKYTLLDGVPQLVESPFDIGLVAPRSLVTINGVHFFLGRRGSYVSIFKYDGVHEPVDIGERIYPEIKEAINEPNVVLEEAVGWFDKHSKQYKIAINSYTLAA